MDEICASTWEPLYRYVYFKVQNREEAEDIIQETYVRALSNTRKTGRKPDKYLPFLKKVALNIVRDRWRKNKRWGTNADLDSINPINTVVDDHAEASTQHIWIENALKKLNSEQRMVIELRIIKGFSVAETAKIMNKKEPTVRVLQYRSLQMLSNLLDKS